MSTKPYGYRLRVGLVEQHLLRLVELHQLRVTDIEPFTTLTLYRTGNAATVRSWALRQQRTVSGRRGRVTTIEQLTPLTQAEYQALLEAERSRETMG